VWVPVNFLAAAALQHYGRLPGPQQRRAQGLYARLRDNVVRNVLKVR
jgi:mannosyl-oligosaccharide glucosidase